MDIRSFQAHVLMPYGQDTSVRLKQAALLFDKLYIERPSALGILVPEVEQEGILSSSTSKVIWHPGGRPYEELGMSLAFSGYKPEGDDPMRVAHELVGKGIADWSISQRPSLDALAPVANWWFARDWPGVTTESVELIRVKFSDNDGKTRVCLVPPMELGRKLTTSRELCASDLIASVSGLSTLILDRELAKVYDKRISAASNELANAGWSADLADLRTATRGVLLETMVSDDVVAELSVEDIASIRSRFKDARQDLLVVYLNGINEIIKEAKPGTLRARVEDYVLKTLEPKFSEFRREQSAFRLQMFGKLSMPVVEGLSRAALAAAGIGVVTLAPMQVGGTAAVALAALAGAATKAPVIIQELFDQLMQLRKRNGTWMSYQLQLSGKSSQISAKTDLTRGL